MISAAQCALILSDVGKSARAPGKSAGRKEKKRKKEKKKREKKKKERIKKTRTERITSAQTALARKQRGNDSRLTNKVCILRVRGRRER